MSQRVRRNGSPTPAGSLGGGAVATAGGAGSRLQPMRATVPFQLKQQQQHGSDKTRPPSSSPSSIIRRTSSLDTLAAPYLAGHWPRDSQGQAAPCMRDKATQTESAWAEEYSEKKKGSHKRSASWGSTDQLKEVRKMIPKNWCGKIKRVSTSAMSLIKEYCCSLEELRGGYQMRTVIAGGQNEKLCMSMGSMLQTREFKGNILKLSSPLLFLQAPVPKSALIPVIPITKSTGSRFRNSVEGLNQEIEIIIKETGEKEEQLIETENGNNSPLPKYATSPKPNNSYMFKREPPEGCERVKVFEECSPKQLHEIPAFYCPDKNKVNFIPKSGSAFCLVSILKPLLPTPDLTLKGSAHSLTVTTGMTTTLLQPIAVASLSANTEQDRVSRGTSTVMPSASLLPPPEPIEEAEG
ncbi:protein FAM117B [Leptonychotes weddellii]|uniref:Protein FAM117B n=1 Tax=Leptonychotes weddellii TaxID=9713 RepID=A0A7F8QY57_LEPWE|nr:protein FAM117B [Leptonychotes weddellii]